MVLIKSFLICDRIIDRAETIYSWVTSVASEVKPAKDAKNYKMRMGTPSPMASQRANAEINEEEKSNVWIVSNFVLF